MERSNVYNKKNLRPLTRIAVTFFLRASIKKIKKRKRKKAGWGVGGGGGGRGRKKSSQATYIGSTVLLKDKK